MGKEMTDFTRRQFLASTAAALCAGQSRGAAARKPNVLVIVADDLGYGELGCQGNRQIPTPNIDSLAANGTRFTNGYVSAPVCCPSRAGIMTGRIQTRFGHEFNAIGAQNKLPGVGLPLSEFTFGNGMKSAGYATAAIGKWHLGGTLPYNPTRRGFDEFFGFLHEGHFYVPPSNHDVATHLRDPEPPYDEDNPIMRGTQVVQEKQYLTEAFTREAISYMERHKSQPFFLYLAYNSIHSPMQALQSYMKRFDYIQDQHRRVFAAMTACMDDCVGKLLATLRKENLEQDTLIYFVSDNGGPTSELTSSNLPLRGFKGNVYEGGIRTPCMVQWKGHIPAGRTYDQPVVSLDIMPTALAAAGAKIPSNLDGVNLLPYLTGKEKKAPHEVLFWRYGGATALRKGNWKLLKQPERGKPNAEFQLFDLSRDIPETTDLAAQKPEIVKDLLARLNAMNAQMVPALWGGQAKKKK